MHKPVEQNYLAHKRRKKRKDSQRMASRNEVQGNLAMQLLWLALTAQLLCDICFPMANLAPLVKSVAGEPQQDDSAPAASRQRLLVEPSDASAIVGQVVELPCSVENKRGQLYWTRGKFALGFESISNSFAPRYSLPWFTAAPNAAEEPPVSNGTLRINGVNLLDDAHFQCSVTGGHDHQYQPLISRAIKLTVLQPPARLSVTHRLAGPEVAGEASDVSSVLAGGLQPNDAGNETPSNGGPTNLSPFNNIDAEWQATDARTAKAQTGANADIEWPPGRPDEQIERIVVKQNERLSLECRADQAKPHAELVWLDHELHKVPKRHAPNSKDSYVDELISMVDGSQSKLMASVLVWTFGQVQRHHSNQLLTCEAHHPAYRDQQLFPQLYGRQLRRQVRLEVQYEPEITLVKDQAAYENRPIKFHCQVQAHPNELTYRWFIDDVPIANASEPELRIERLTRQLHSRTIKCQVTNAVGTSSAIQRLSVRYAPAYVTHLLPSSLQPAPLVEPSVRANFLAHLKGQQQQASPRQRNQAARVANELALSRQLALGFERGQSVQLRCDFDSNASPRPLQVTWYKIITDYSVMKNVTPAEADELIATGALHALFRDQNSPPSNGQLLLPEVVGQHERSNQREHTKRHIAQPHQAQSSASFNEPSAQLPFEGQLQVDYEQMSAELIEEVAMYEAQQAKVKQQAATGEAHNSFLMGEQILHQISQAMAPTQSNVLIYEPLDWGLRYKLVQQPIIAGADSSGQVASSNSSQPAVRRQEHVQYLSLLQPWPGSTSSAQLGANSTTSRTNLAAKLLTREAHVSSSFIELTNANEDSIGKYVCLAKSSDGHLATARAVYLVQRDRPRIISIRDQWAPLGRLQVECLVQINTVADNSTSIVWYKNGKIIDVMRKPEHGAKGGSEKRFAILEERSPDLLFMRSTLRIEGAERSDFGLYNCTITNSYGSDHTEIDLQISSQTGFVFTVMASLTIASILALACVVGLLIVCTPRRKLDVKEQLPPGPAANCGSDLKQQQPASKPGANGQCELDGSQSDVDRKSPRSLESQEDEGIAACSQMSDQQQQQYRDTSHLANEKQQQQQQLSLTQSSGHSGSMLMLRQQQQHQLSTFRSEMDLDDSRAGLYAGSMHSAAYGATYHHQDEANHLLQQQQQQQQQLGYFPALDPSNQIVSNGYTNQALAWSDQSQSAAPLGHYQLTMLAAENPYGVQQAQPQQSGQQQAINGHPCYATVLTSQPQQFVQASNGHIYGTMPMRPASVQCTQIVPTSDAGDSYFDTNYDTLISRSSAYKTLGYATGGSSSNNSSSLAQNGIHSASSSPNSLTTQPNNGSGMVIQDSLHQTISKLGLIQRVADGPITTTTTTTTTTPASTKNLNDNGLATHV